MNLYNPLTIVLVKVSDGYFLWFNLTIAMTKLSKVTINIPKLNIKFSASTTDTTKVSPF
ncbi:hypothetical protein ACPA2F_08805 [Staphylococcus aureus]|uniref:hypothetical protein n=1 Tax=Staphylococcus aureus TaxID=1280 RepID=UPI003C2C9653